MSHERPQDGVGRRTGFVVGLIGEGIAKSLTPPMHEVEAAALGIPYEYRILDLLQLGLSADAVGPLLREAHAEGYAAMNITHPCKQLVLAVVDELAADAEQLGAANLVVFDDGRLVGHNTDWVGFRDAMVERLPGASLDRVAQLGAGGAGAATAYALLRLGVVDLMIADQDAGRAAELASRMASLFPAQRVVDLPRSAFDAALADVDGVVHATPMGMAHHPGIAFDIDLLADRAWVADVVYRPLETELVRAARTRGHVVLDGGRMAVGQAYTSLEIITRRRPDRTRMLEHFREMVRAEELVAPDS